MTTKIRKDKIGFFRGEPISKMKKAQLLEFAKWSSRQIDSLELTTNTRLLSPREYKTKYPSCMHDLIKYVVNKEEGDVPDHPRPLWKDTRKYKSVFTKATQFVFSGEILRAISL